MQEKYRYALLHFFHSTPFPRYFGIIVRVNEDTKCPPIFHHMYAFQWINASHELDEKMYNAKGVIEKEDGLEVSEMYYIAKRVHPEQVSRKAYMHICDKDHVIRIKKVYTYMRENNLHLLTPYMASDMEYELFIPAAMAKSVCIPHAMMLANISRIPLEDFEKTNWSARYYDEH